MKQKYVYTVRDDKEFINEEKLQNMLTQLIGDNVLILLLTNPDKRTKLTAMLPDYEQLFCTFLPGEPYERYMKENTKIYKIIKGEWYE